MAKSRPSRSSTSEKGQKSQAKARHRKPHKILPTRIRESTPEQLLESAANSLEKGDVEEALQNAGRALKRLREREGDASVKTLPALSLLGEIAVEMGDMERARDTFQEAAALDPEGEVKETEGGGAEKFLWLAQLCEQGGKESVGWFEIGVKVLRRENAEMEDEGKRGKLASALCAVAEIYMTDLSWEEDAEVKCEKLVTEALMMMPNSSEVLQTLASVRISQLKIEEARKALRQSMELWRNVRAEGATLLDFPIGISLARLLMEVEMEGEALEVLELLVGADDSSVEAWYLGGWCQRLIAERKTNSAEKRSDEDSKTNIIGSRHWLQTSLRLYESQCYEDERLRDHAVELVNGLDAVLGSLGDEDEQEDAEEEWEDDSEDDEDSEMKEA
ncbi:MAG: hypothetical protein Q9190_008061 [Brigantiaea leucoxantha]